MIARFQNVIAEWLKRAAAAALTWLKQHCPEPWQESLEKIQAVHLGPMIQAGCEPVNRYANTINMMLVVYFLATASLLDVVVMVTVTVGLILAMNNLADSDGQEV